MADRGGTAFPNIVREMIVAERELVVVGGPNGAGKTTAALVIAALCDGLYLGADAIAAEMDPDDPFRVRIAASRRFIERIRAELPGSRRLVVETTLSGRTFARTVDAARRAGRPVVTIFTWLPSPGQCIRRIAGRVAAGGHHVPDEDVVRRFDRSLRNFAELFAPRSDHWLLVDNSGRMTVPVAAWHANELRIYHPVRWREFQHHTGSPPDEQDERSCPDGP